MCSGDRDFQNGGNQSFRAAIQASRSARRNSTICCFPRPVHALWWAGPFPSRISRGKGMRSRPAISAAAEEVRRSSALVWGFRLVMQVESYQYRRLSGEVLICRWHLDNPAACPLN